MVVDVGVFVSGANREIVIRLPGLDRGVMILIHAILAAAATRLCMSPRAGE